MNRRLSRISFSASGLAKSTAAKPKFFLGRRPAANSAAYGYTPNVGLTSSKMVLTGVGKTVGAEEKQAPSTDSI